MLFPIHNPAQQAFNWYCRSNNISEANATSACIEGQLIHELFGGSPSLTKDKNQRQACGCVESVDMGIYNTCQFRCSYCYANFNETMIDANIRKHYQDSPSLLDRHEGVIELQTTLNKKKKCGNCQQDLF